MYTTTYPLDINTAAAADHFKVPQGSIVQTVIAKDGSVSVVVTSPLHAHRASVELASLTVATRFNNEYIEDHTYLASIIDENNHPVHFYYKLS